MSKISIISELPNEPILGIKSVFIVIDSDLKIHYELHQSGKFVKLLKNFLKPSNFIGPGTISKKILQRQASIPLFLIESCASTKNNIVGVLGLKIYYKKDYNHARFSGLGILDTIGRNRSRALFRLLMAMDKFCRLESDYFVLSLLYWYSYLLTYSVFCLLLVWLLFRVVLL